VREEHSWRATPLGSFSRVSNNVVCVPTSDQVHDALHTNKLDGPARNLMLGAQEELGTGGRLEGLGFGHSAGGTKTERMKDHGAIKAGGDHGDAWGGLAIYSNMESRGKGRRDPSDAV
jgi:hypothetical protein